MAERQGLRLTKHHGAGNDFLVLLDPADERPVRSEEALGLCHRRLGIGADGLLRATLAPSGGSLTMELRNADGSIAEMSGNGIRCLVQAAVDGGLVAAGSVAVQTAAGLRIVDYRAGERPGAAWGSVAMGEGTVGADLSAGELAAELAEVSGAQVAEEARWVAQELGEVRSMCRVDMGNPHLVLFAEAAIAAQVGRLGPVLAASGPSGTNVELVSPGPGEGELSLRVWERGVGETLACGTGTCAAAAAARRWGMAGDQVLVHNPGGMLQVAFTPSGMVLSGPTVKVASLTVHDDALATMVAATRSTTAGAT